METLDPKDMEILDPNDIEVEDTLSEDDIEVLPPPTLPEKVAKNVSNLVPSSQTLSQTSQNISPILESASDLSKGVASGLTLGSLDELGGAAAALLEKGASYIPGTGAYEMRQVEEKEGFPSQSLIDKYREYQQTGQKELQAAEERSPVLYTAGQIGGGITSGAAMGALPGLGASKAAPSIAEIAKNQGKLKALAELGIRGGKAYGAALPAIAVESALSSKEGAIETEAGREQLAEDVVGGALFGLPAVLGLQTGVEVAAPLARESAQAISQKAKNLIEETPLLRQMGVAYDYGKQGINPKNQTEILKSELGTTSLSELDNQRTKALIDEIMNADKAIGKSVGDSLVSATQRNVNVDVTQDVSNSLNKVFQLAQRYPEIADNARAEQIISKIAQSNGRITPIDAKDMLDYLDAYIAKFKAASNKTPAEEGVLSTLLTTRKDFSNTLKSSVPEYAEAAARFESFRRLVPETIIAKSKPVDIKNDMFGNVQNKEEKLFSPLKQLLQGSTKEGSGNRDVQQAFVNTIKGLKEFEAQDLQRLQQGKISQTALNRPVTEIEKQIKQFSDDAVTRGSMDALDPQSGVQPTALSAFTGLGNTGRSIALSAANKAGRVMQKPSGLAKFTRNVYNLPDEALGQLANKLNQTQGLRRYGQSLQDALSSTDVKRRNQILFTIMQNPEARALVQDESQLAE